MQTHAGNQLQQPVLILDDAGIEVGSAFFVNTDDSTWLVTVKHVHSNRDRGIH